MSKKYLQTHDWLLVSANVLCVLIWFIYKYASYRHPDSSSRPDFVSVVQQLSLPDTKLLKWSEEDKTIDPEAAILGAGLDKAVNLYQDLQKQYIE